MKIGNFAMELADYRAEQEREAGIRRAREAINGAGAIMCIDCPDEIEPARRRACPSAERCSTCQTRFERNRRRS